MKNVKYLKKGVMATAFSAFATAGMMNAATAKPAPKSMKTSNYITSQPIGHHNFCKAHYDECQKTEGQPEIIRLNTRRWDELVGVNDIVNRDIFGITDQELHNKEEYWVYPKHAGDCEDYALQKRKMLMDLGWPAESLLITIALQHNGEGHAVLTVKTDQGDYILDNLSTEVLPFAQTTHTYIKRQSEYHAGQWRDVIQLKPTVVNGPKLDN